MKTPWVSLLVAIAFLAGGCRPGEETSPEVSGPPNLILISLDALRADHLSSHGYHRRTTPFLDQLAAEGTRFSHATVNTHGTPPSHTTMLSSLYQETHRVGIGLTPGQPEAPLIPTEIELLPEILRRAGWKTVAVTGGGWMSGGYGFSRGFDRFVSGDMTADIGVDTVVTALTETVTKEQPFFALFHTYQVHSPYLPPKGYRTLFGNYKGSIRPTSKALMAIASDASRHLEASDFDYLVSRYDGEIRFLDDQLRILFDRLEAAGMLDNTVVLITADHGEEFGDHGGLLHRATLFDELVRVPFILWGSGIPSGVVDPSLVSLIDIAPTLLTLGGVEIPPAMEGRNVFDPSPASWLDQRAFAQYGEKFYCIRTPRFKLILGHRNQRWLFDLENDPKEKRNLAAVRPDLTAELVSELETWKESRQRLADEALASTEIDPTTEEQLRKLGYIE